jgi:hypothetical protein
MRKRERRKTLERSLQETLKEKSLEEKKTHH